MTDEKAHRLPVEPMTLDLGRLSDCELQQATVAAMRAVTAARSLGVQRFYFGLTSALVRALIARDELWVGEFAPVLAEIGRSVGAEDGNGM